MEAYLDFLTELGALFTQLTDLEREKMSAAQAGDLDRLNSCICREQAMSLSLRGMDRRRETMLEELGMTGDDLRQLPERCPPQLQARAKAVVDRSSAAVMRSLIPAGYPLGPCWSAIFTNWNASWRSWGLLRAWSRAISLHRQTCPLECEQIFMPDRRVLP